MTAEDTKSHLAREITGDFRNTLYEGGMEHPAERTLERWLTPDREADTLPALEEICLDEQRPALAADTLKCLAVLERRPGDTRWRAELVRRALASDDIEIRDAAIQASEHWTWEPEIMIVLMKHKDPDKWLQDYLDAVVSDLEGTAMK